MVTGGAGAAASRPIYNTPAPAARVPARPAVETDWERPVRSRVAPAPVAAPVSRRVEPRFSRQEVDYSGPHAPGTIVVDTPRRFLYLVQPGGRAIRYGIGVGRPGFEWAGVKRVTRKAEWPDWRPPPAMLKRRPDLPRFMKGGPENPLGARALYLGSSLYRIHGTNEPWTIGRNVSSGCIRMMNNDVIDLYQRVRVGSRVVVI
jgi:lipoprotein-anchoring transpeptidase ErfK/SrfK